MAAGWRRIRQGLRSRRCILLPHLCRRLSQSRLMAPNDVEQRRANSRGMSTIGNWTAPGAPLPPPSAKPPPRSPAMTSTLISRTQAAKLSASRSGRRSMILVGRVDQNGAVAMAAAPRPIVDADHAQQRFVLRGGGAPAAAACRGWSACRAGSPVSPPAHRRVREQHGAGYRSAGRSAERVDHARPAGVRQRSAVRRWYYRSGTGGLERACEHAALARADRRACACSGYERAPRVGHRPGRPPTRRVRERR